MQCPAWPAGCAGDSFLVWGAPLSRLLDWRQLFQHRCPEVRGAQQHSATSSFSSCPPPMGEVPLSGHISRTFKAWISAGGGGWEAPAVTTDRCHPDLGQPRSVRLQKKPCVTMCCSGKAGLRYRTVCTRALGKEAFVVLRPLHLGVCQAGPAWGTSQ